VASRYEHTIDADRFQLVYQIKWHPPGRFDFGSARWNIKRQFADFIAHARGSFGHDVRPIRVALVEYIFRTPYSTFYSP
jgi:hypothetical protein